MTFSGLSDSGLLLLGLILLAAPILALVALNFYLKRRKPSYKWQPEQDYDVELQGESAMQPPLTVLKERKKTTR